MLSKIFTITAVFGFAFVAQEKCRPVVSAQCTRSYTVKAGDYCDSISRENNVSTFQLATVNKGKINDQCTDLQPGATLCLGNTGEDCTETYVVKLGDTCDGVSGASGLNNTILYHNNPQIDQGCTNIYVGEVLCVAKTVQVPAVPSTGVVVPVSGPPANPNPADNQPPPTVPSPITVTPSSVAYGTPAANATPTPAVDPTADDDNLPFCDEI